MGLFGFVRFEFVLIFDVCVSFCMGYTGMVCFGLVLFGLVWFGVVWFDLLLFGSFLFGLMLSGLVRLDMLWCCLA